MYSSRSALHTHTAFHTPHLHTPRHTPRSTTPQVRKGFGETFHEHFWPVFRAFNCVLPAHAPEEDGAASAAASAAGTEA